MTQYDHYACHWDSQYMYAMLEQNEHECIIAERIM